jgi:DNA primase
MHDDPESDGHGSHKCFGCGFSGGPVELLQERLGFSLSHALNWITERGLWMEARHELRLSVQVKQMRSRTECALPPGTVFKPYEQWIGIARQYLDQRGVEAWQVERWGLGYTVDGQAGGRVVIPVRDALGTVRNYHARSFVCAAKRFVNASEDEGFDPSGIFGAQVWPPITERSGQTLVVTEASLDAMACERAGAKFIGAFGGSEPHPRQLTQLQGWKQVVSAADGDHAGDKLTKLIAAGLGAAVNLVRAPMPRGCDACELTTDELAEVLCLQ